MDAKTLLAWREQMNKQREAYLLIYGAPLIHFTMEIPPGGETLPGIRAAFDEGTDALLFQLMSKGAPVLDRKEWHGETGDEMLLAVDFAPDQLKELAVFIEDHHRFGSFFRIEVYEVNGARVARTAYRKCLICGRPVPECERLRRHTKEEYLAAAAKRLSG